MQISEEKNQTKDQPPSYQEESDDQQSESLPLYEDHAPPHPYVNNPNTPIEREQATRKGRSWLSFILKAALLFYIAAFITLHGYRFLDHALRPYYHRHHHHHHEHHEHGPKQHHGNPGPGCGRDPLSHSANRRYTRHETSQAITGHFDLYDLLDLSTTAGHIDITVTPHPGSKPAVLKIHSTAGSVTVRFANEFLATAQSLLVQNRDLAAAVDAHPALAPLTRTFMTDIRTSAGAVQATILGGNGGNTVIESQAGSVRLDFLTVGVGPDSRVSRLRTVTQSGEQMVRVEPLDRVGAGKVSRLAASHASQGSGALDIRYPREWEGRLESVIQGSGSTNVNGEGLEIDEEYGSTLRAHKGEGDEVVKIFVQGSGSVKFRC